MLLISFILILIMVSLFCVLYFYYKTFTIEDEVEILPVLKGIGTKKMRIPLIALACEEGH